MPRNKFTLLTILLLTGSQAFSQTSTQTELLRKAGAQQAAKERSGYERLQQLARQKNWPLSMARKNGGIAILTGTDRHGKPVYLATESNVIAATTIGANRLWEGGDLGLNLNGSSDAVKNKMGLWDGGKVLNTHRELTGRIVNEDNTAFNDHATHVAGTLMATGLRADAKGMAYKMQEMHTHDFNNHSSEMLDAATSLLVSNHSYGEIAGWSFNESLNRWEFWGPYNENEDPRFGMYTAETQLWDSIAYNAPYYLIVKSSGNNRDENGPPVGDDYWYYDPATSSWVKAPNGRPATISSNNGYDIISSYGIAKNILTVGAVNSLAAGYTGPTDVQMSSFSSWGPSDDGRIKPDVVADGVSLTSSVASATNAYATYSGTSMATPSVTGSMLLLQEYYLQQHSNPAEFMRAATLKALVIHTADEAGPHPGPDYMFGWGLVNAAKAALLIKDDNYTKNQIIQERTIPNNNTYTYSIVASGNGPLVATICWTDPKGSITPDENLNDPTPKLVHDLDLRISDGTTTFLPWVLNPNNRPAAATKGDNKLDNVEKIEIDNPVAGRTYTITVSHKGTIRRPLQAFSLIISGVDGSTVTSIANADPAAIGLRVSPNPNNGQFVADFNVTRKADLNISILNTLGQKVYENNYPGFVGRFNKTIEASHLTAGVYMLRILHDNKSYLTRLLIR